MKIYASYGFNEFILALGYKADYIKEFFLNQKSFTSDFTLKTKKHEISHHLENHKDIDDFKITFVDTGLNTLPGERILRCSKYIPKDNKFFMVTYGDGVTDLNIKKLLKFHKKHKKIGTITGVHPRTKYGLIKIDKDSTVNKFIEKPILTDWVSGGFMIFNRSFFSYLREGEMEHPALKRLIKEKQLSLYSHNGFWHAVDTYNDLKDLNDIWDTGKAPWKVW